jgi:tRNA threonylcarbamoyladenosine biosynthesis protein TsaB
MKILSIDTSTEACSAALNIDNEIQVLFEIAPQQHSALILQQCEQLLSNANLTPSQLDAVAFGQGPGSFTGLRIAAGVTQGIAFAADLPVVGISTLAAQAQKICTEYPEHVYLSAIDARMKEIYWALYTLPHEQQTVELQSTEVVGIAEKVNIQNSRPMIGIGSGWKEYRNDLLGALKEYQISNIYPDILPSAEEISVLAAIKLQRGEGLSAEKAIPVYLRNDVAKKRGSK